jgi:plastocyanin
MKKVAALLLLVLASVALVACGGSSSSSSTNSGAEGAAAAGGSSEAASGGGQVLKLETDPNGELKYTTEHLTAKPGAVTIDLTNPQSLSHDVAVEDSAGKVIGESEQVIEGSTSLVLKDLKPGSYTYFCSVPGHRDAGMEGTLTVK